nr:MAG TPA: hypothetical protein [Caudoviricetes sp.]
MYFPPIFLPDILLCTLALYLENTISNYQILNIIFLIL